MNTNYLDGPSTRAQVITRRTYNRPLDEAGGIFETWDQTVDRVIGHQRWLWERAVDRDLSPEEDAELAVLRRLMIERKVTTSGRTLWLGGTNIAKTREASQFNPLPISTKVVTETGVRSFEDMEDEEAVRVVTHKGRVQNAVFMSAGIREMYRLHLRRGRSEAVQDTSVDHTWILKDGSRVIASDLKIGHQIHAAPAESFYDWAFETAEPDEQMWWCYGFVFGDGSIAKSGNSVTSRVRLCGDKAAHLSKFQDCGFGFSYPPSCKGDPFVWTGGYLKTLPEEDANPRLIKAFLSGYMAADGNKKNQRGQTIITGLSTTSDVAADFICRWMPVFGVYILRDDHVKRETNYGEFVGREMSFTTYGSVGGNLWTVSGIEQIAPEECACLTVEEDHSFVLPNGVVSGNCSFLRVETVSDIADGFWLLLQGCGVGFEPITGVLNGFACEMEVEIIPSTRTEKGGRETNKETVKNGVWTISVGDSAMAWSKAAAKVLAGKRAAKKLVLDFSEVRPAGLRLNGYGWISSGYVPFAKALFAVADLMNHRVGKILSRLDILDVMNLLGTTLSSRRSAEIAVVPWTDPEAEEFAVAKRDYFVWEIRTGEAECAVYSSEDCSGEIVRLVQPGEKIMPWGSDVNGMLQVGIQEWMKTETLWQPRIQRAQSNNSLLFYDRPTRYELFYIFDLMAKGGGSEPGFLNGREAHRRAPWFKGVNPCLTGDTLVPIKGRGLVRIETLAGSYAKVRDGNGDETEALFEQTSSSAPILCVELSDGSQYRVTPSHDFVLESGEKRSAETLSPGDALKVSDVKGCFGSHHDPKRAYLDAWLLADGTWHNNHDSSKLDLYAPKHHYREELESAGAKFTGFSSLRNTMTAFFPRRPAIDKSRIPSYVLEGDRGTMWAFVRGYTQSDGHVGHTDKGWLVQYTSVSRDTLQELQAMLRLFEVRSKLAPGRPEGERLLPDGKGGSALYPCRATWRLTVSNPAQFFAHYDPSLNKRGSYVVKEKISVVSVVDTGENEAVYCAGVSTTASFDLTNIHSGNCAEILLGNKSFCNLVETDAGKFNGDLDGLIEALYVAARANYRQTCVDLRDEVLQASWHELNTFLRLCGVGLTGIVRWEGNADPEMIRALRKAAQDGANSMADELGLTRSKAVTTIKPSGTLSKIMDTTEGIHKPLGRYILNNVNFSKFDPIIPRLVAAGYKVFESPVDDTAVLVCFPVCYEDVEFDIVDGKEVNIESAVSQLDRYKLWMMNYVDHNCSITISYSPDEVLAIIDWLIENWSHYVGVSFIYRNDPTKTAADLGYQYLPQEVVTQEVYDTYLATLSPLDWTGTESFDEIADPCSTGACPVK